MAHRFTQLVEKIVYLDADEVKDLPYKGYLGAGKTKVPAENSKAVIKYITRGEEWLLSSMVVIGHRIKKDGTPYAEESDYTVWNAYKDEDFGPLVMKHWPTEKVTIKIEENDSK